jgi:hypothetical protein
MRGVIPPLPQYTFMAWYSVEKSAGTALPLSFIYFAKDVGPEFDGRLSKDHLVFVSWISVTFTCQFRD